MTTSDVDATTESGGPYMTEARHRAGPVLDPQTQVTVARRLFAHIDNKTTDSADEILRFDASVYTDPRILAREREMIFDTTPVIVAHSSEIARPNDFLRVSLPGADVLVVRQRDGGVKAMLNSCRHRGTALTLEMSGNKKLFMCPYHAWCYGPDGSLDFVTDAATVGPIDKKSFGSDHPNVAIHLHNLAELLQNMNRPPKPSRCCVTHSRFSTQAPGRIIPTR